MEEGDVRPGGCERRMTKLFGLGGVLKGLQNGEWSKSVKFAQCTYYPYYREEERRKK